MHSPLLEQYFAELNKCAAQGSILDLACGEGRNGLFLANNGMNITFADRDETSLTQISHQLNAPKHSSHIWPVDLETPGINPLERKTFSAALVFRYLHRPLIPQLMDAITPGGLIFYETFTLENRQFGRPNNPNFLLKERELSDWFNEWETLHYFEGIVHEPNRAIAQIVCRKPDH